MGLGSQIKRTLPSDWSRSLRELLLPFRVQHLSGPKQIQLAPNEAAVTCLLKNGEFYLPSFIRHYSQMGFRHIFLLDNGSTDRTLEIAGSFDNVSVFSTGLPVDVYQGILKGYLARRTVKSGWCLDVDVDEFFDFPFSQVLGLRQFLGHLNRKRFNVVVTQMLDVFADRPLSSLAESKDEDLKKTYRYYDISEVRKADYRSSTFGAKYADDNLVSHPGTALYFGGIRKTLYGLDPLLTKHSLFCTGQNLELFRHVHFVNRARLADVCGLLVHYKLTSNAKETSRQNHDAFIGISKGYADFLDTLARRPDYQLRQATAGEFKGTQELLDQGFLFASDDFRALARDASAEPRPSTSPASSQPAGSYR
jgi:hypothetical protein